jgi:membrane fusion protein (multidrug efflux system)
MRKIIKSLLIGILLASIISTISCGPKKPKEMPPPEIPVYEIVLQDIPIREDYVGQTMGILDISIRARVEGFLESKHFTEGSTVKEDQLLYTIDPQPFQAMVAEQESNVTRAKTGLVKAESDLNRIRPLAEMNAVSQSDLDAAIAQYDAAKAEVAASEASLRLAKIELGYTRIYAPTEGIIGISNVDVGDFVGKSPNPVILNAVSRVDSIRVRFSITESEYLRLIRFMEERGVAPEARDREAQDLELILIDGSVHDYTGNMDFATREINPTTGTLLLQASFPNPRGVLRPGQFAKVRIVIHVIEDGILVPQRCIKELQGIFQVFVVTPENEVEIRRIEPGTSIGNMRVVTEGLSKGEKVVLEGLQRVQPGVKIVPIVQEFKLIDAGI